MQTRLHSALEALANTAVGYLTAFPINWAVSYAFGYTMPAGENITLITVFTLFSLLRQYLIRRLFVHIRWKRLKVQAYVTYLRFRFRKESDTVCCCGGEESNCGWGCLPASFVSAKWYAINNAVEHRFGKDTEWR